MQRARKQLAFAREAPREAARANQRTAWHQAQHAHAKDKVNPTLCGRTLTLTHQVTALIRARKERASREGQSARRTEVPTCRWRVVDFSSAWVGLFLSDGVAAGV